MATTTTADRGDARTLARAAVGLGLLSIILFFGLAEGFKIGDWWFVVAFVVGIAAVVAGWVARSRAGADHRRLATIGLVLGAIPVVWFVVYMIVAAIF